MTDVAGFTELMRTNEPQTLTSLKSDIDMIRAHIARNGGEVVKVAGDGILALFSSAPKAVRACIDSQDALSDSTLKHRMAIHAGEITLTEGDAYGDAVNVCSRLETITTPGTVTASRIVIDLIEAQGLPDPVKRGKVQLKGIDSPVEVFSWGIAKHNLGDKKWLWLIVAALFILVLASAGIAWKLNSEPPARGSRRSLPPVMSFMPDPGLTTDEILDQAFDDIWQEIDEYDAVKAEAVEKVDAQIAIDWLTANPLGKRERGQRELDHWRLVQRAIEKGKALAGPKATPEQIWQSLNKNPQKGLDLEIKAFAEEFRRPK